MRSHCNAAIPGDGIVTEVQALHTALAGDDQG
jgi:hypothetical protein